MQNLRNEALLRVVSEKLQKQQQQQSSSSLVNTNSVNHPISSRYILNFASQTDNPDEVIRRLHRRRQFELSLPLVTVTPITILCFRSGAFSMMPTGDAFGRPILFIRPSKIPPVARTALITSTKEAEVVALMLLEYLSHVSMKKQTHHYHSHHQDGGNKANGSSSNKNGGRSTSNHHSSTSSTSKQQQVISEVAILIDATEADSAWIRQPLVNALSAVSSQQQQQQQAKKAKKRSGSSKSSSSKTKFTNDYSAEDDDGNFTNETRDEEDIDDDDDESVFHMSEEKILKKSSRLASSISTIASKFYPNLVSSCWVALPASFSSSSSIINNQQQSSSSSSSNILKLISFRDLPSIIDPKVLPIRLNGKNKAESNPFAGASAVFTSNILRCWYSSMTILTSEQHEQEKSESKAHTRSQQQMQQRPLWVPLCYSLISHLELRLPEMLMKQQQNTMNSNLVVSTSSAGSNDHMNNNNNNNSLATTVAGGLVVTATATSLSSEKSPLLPPSVNKQNSKIQDKHSLLIRGFTDDFTNQAKNENLTDADDDSQFLQTTMVMMNNDDGGSTGIIRNGEEHDDDGDVSLISSTVNQVHSTNLEKENEHEEVDIHDDGHLSSGYNNREGEKELSSDDVAVSSRRNSHDDENGELVMMMKMKKPSAEAEDDGSSLVDAEDDEEQEHEQGKEQGRELSVSTPITCPSSDKNKTKNQACSPESDKNNRNQEQDEERKRKLDKLTKDLELERRSRAQLEAQVQRLTLGVTIHHDDEDDDDHQIEEEGSGGRRRSAASALFGTIRSCHEEVNILIAETIHNCQERKKLLVSAARKKKDKNSLAPSLLELFDAFERTIAATIASKEDVEGAAGLPGYLLKASEVVHRRPPENSGCSCVVQ